MTARMKRGIDVESGRVDGGGSNIESTKHHRGQLAKMKAMLEVSGKCLKRSIRSMRLEDA